MVQIGGAPRAVVGVDCLAWGQFLMALKQFEAQKHYEAVDKIEAAMNRLATKIMADPRRVQAVQTGCPTHYVDIQRRGGSGATARHIPDPAHDRALLEGWMQSLPDELLAEIEAAAKAEATSRKKAKASKTKKKP